MGKARLELMIADLLVARQAGNAMAAADYKGHGNPLAQLPVPDIFTDSHNGACQLMSRHMGKLYIGIVTLPAVPVTPANARGIDGKHDPVVRGYGIGNFDYGYRGLELVEDGRKNYAQQSDRHRPCRYRRPDPRHQGQAFDSSLDILCTGRCPHAPCRLHVRNLQHPFTPQAQGDELLDPLGLHFHNRGNLLFSLFSLG